MMKKLILSIALLPAALASAQEITSPDGKLKVNVSADNGRAYYSVVLENDTVIRKSPLGMKTDMGDFTQNIKLASCTESRAVSESYTLPHVKKANISYTANEATWMFNGAKSDKPVFSVTFHVDNNNVAFKYDIKAQRDRRACIVENECTGYVLPEGTTTFICPQMTPQTGFARTAPSYETHYELDGEMGKNGHGRGYTFPALFKAPTPASPRGGAAGAAKKGMKDTSASNIWIMLSETNIGGNYCGSRLVPTGKDSYGLAYPEKGEFGGVGSCEPGLMLDGKNGEIPHAETPWRTITVGRTLAPITETTIQWDLVKPQYEASQEYKYGRATWSWIIRMDASCNFDEQKEYIDFAADMGYEYVLIDAFWDSNIGYDRMAQLSKYAQGKGVGLFLWYNSNGYWNDAPQGPRGKMHRMLDRRKEMKWLKEAGIKGLKVDFVGSDKQQTMQMYEDILADANEFGLMIIFHGCTLQRGWERMYPNFVSCEAVRASENMAFSQGECDNEAKNATIHAVLRNSAGNMDFGGSTLNKHYSKNNQRGNERKTSDVYALATAILFQTPVQNFAVTPNNLTDAPQWAMDFMKAVPVTWQDMRFIDGYPGKFTTMARKHNDTWYVASINAQEEAYTTTLKLDMFAPGTILKVYSDDPALNGSVKTVKLPKNQTLKVTVPCNGGLVVTTE
ncbi:MAG: glycoside hydrolase family 97 protein [Prevotella sp.]|nr:glycoside hydrolase family 97 protein [Prevotella sp.]